MGLLDDIFQNQKAVDYAARKHTVSGNYGMAASAVKEATEAGEQVLKDGGNAVDAIIAIQLALAAVEGMNTGIGASGFMVIHDSERNETKVINGHSQAPSAVTSELFLDKEGKVPPFIERSTEAKAIGIPGIMKAMDVAHERYGTMPLERLIAPAIQLAEEDYEVNFMWNRAIKLFHYRMGEEAKKVFMPNGVPLVEGDKTKQPDLAKTLKTIRDEGFKSVYEGEIADAIIATIQEQGGLMTKKDLQNYRASIDEPLWSNYKEFDLAFPVPPDGGGFAVAQLLKILEPFDIGQYGSQSWEKYYLLAESMRFALSDKDAYIGDPDFIDIPLEGLLHPDYLEERRKLVNFERRNDQVDFGDPWKYQKGEPNRLIQRESVETGKETTHFTAVDQWGNVAACTSSNERMMGSGIMVPGNGFLLNNDLTDFNPEPGSMNEPAAGKQAVSSKTPTILFHGGKPFLTLGPPGGSTIVASVLQVIINVIDYKMDLKKAIAEPRIFNSMDVSVQWEGGIDKEIREKLDDMGFKEETSNYRIGDVQAILIDSTSGKLYGGADSTRPGAAMGLTDPPDGQPGC